MTIGSEFTKARETFTDNPAATAVNPFWTASAGAYSNLFGGGDGTETSTTTQQSGPPAFQLPYLEEIFAEAQRLYGGDGLSFPDFSGVAGFDPWQVAGQAGLQDWALGSGQDYIDAVTRAQEFALGDVLNLESNPYIGAYADAAGADYIREFNEAIAPGLRVEEQAAGQYGGTRGNLALGTAAGRVGETVFDQRAQIYSDAYNRGLQTFETGLSLAPSIAELQTTPYQALLAIGEQRQGLEQAQLDEQTKEFWFNQLAPYLQLEQYLSTVGGSYGGEGTTETTTEGGGGFFGDFFSGLFG